MKYSKRNDNDEVLGIEAAKDIPNNKFSFGCAIYPCCERHMRFELGVTGMKYYLDIFAQRNMKRTALAFIYGDIIINKIKKKLNIKKKDKWNGVKNSAYDMRG